MPSAKICHRQVLKDIVTLGACGLSGLVFGAGVKPGVRVRNQRSSGRSESGLSLEIVAIVRRQVGVRSREQEHGL